MQRRERFEETGNQVSNGPDRPKPGTVRLDGKAAEIVKEVIAPLTEFKVVRGKAIGGGTSKEALRRARRRQAANGS